MAIVRDLLSMLLVVVGIPVGAFLMFLLITRNVRKDGMVRRDDESAN